MADQSVKAMAEQAKQALQALYQGTDPAKAAEANKWIMAFQNSPAAWGVAHELLGASTVEVQFFGANLLYQKICDEWSTLKLEDRQRLHTSLLGRLQQLLQEGKVAPMITLRLARALSVLSVRTVGGCTQLLKQLFALAGSKPELVVEVLIALEEELDRSQLTMQKKEDVTQELSSKLHEVVGLLKAYLSASLQNKNQAAIDKVLQCIHSWQRLGLTLGELHSHALLAPLLALLALPQPLHLHRVVDVLMEGLANKQYPKEKNRDEAVFLIAQCLGSVCSVLFTQASKAKAEEVCRMIARLNSQFGEEETEFVAAGTAEALKVVQLQLACSSHSDPNIVELSLEFWYRLQDIPLEERHPQLRDPVYQQLLMILLHQACYPAAFKNWNSPVPGFSLDSDSFQRFRESLAQTLVVCFERLQWAYVPLIVNQLQKPQLGWHNAEACLFAVCSVSSAVKDLIKRGGSGSASASAQRSQLESALSGLVTGVIQGSFPSHPLLHDTCCRLLGAYAFFFPTHPQLIQPTLSYLYRHITTPTTHNNNNSSENKTNATNSHHNHNNGNNSHGNGGSDGEEAALALRQVIRACAVVFASNSGLVDSALQMANGWESFRRASLSVQRSLCEGLAIAVATQQGEAGSRCLQRLILPFVQAVQQALSQCKPDIDSKQRSLLHASTVHHLSLLSSSLAAQTPISLLPSSSPSASASASASSSVSSSASPVPSHPISANLKSIWEILLPCCQAFGFEASVVASVCEIYLQLLRGLETQSLPFLSPLCTNTLTFFQKSQQAMCIDVLTEAVKLFGDRAEAVAAFSAAISSVFATAMQIIKDQPQDHSDVVLAVLELLKETLDYCPSVLSQTTLLSPCLRLISLSLLKVQDRECISSASLFLESLLSSSVSALPSLPAALQEQAQGLVNALLLAVSDTQPRTNLNKVTKAFYALIHRFSEMSLHFLHQSLSSPSFPSKHIQPQDKQTFMTIVAGLKNNPDRFRAFIIDWHAICHGHDTADQLTLYLLRVQQQQQQQAQPKREEVVILD